MRITEITTEQFAQIHKEINTITEHNPHAGTVVYDGSHSKLGDVAISSETNQCLLFELKA